MIQKTKLNKDLTTPKFYIIINNFEHLTFLSNLLFRKFKIYFFSLSLTYEHNPYLSTYKKLTEKLITKN